jgi:hypothetical protein
MSDIAALSAAVERLSEQVEDLRNLILAGLSFADETLERVRGMASAVPYNPREATRRVAVGFLAVQAVPPERWTDPKHPEQGF